MLTLAAKPLGFPLILIVSLLTNRMSEQTGVHLRELAPGELRRPVALHHNALVLHRGFYHHKVIQQLILISGVQAPLADLLVETWRGCGSTSKDIISSFRFYCNRCAAWNIL